MKKTLTVIVAIFLNLTFLSTTIIASGFFEDSASLEERKPSILLPLIKKYFKDSVEDTLTYLESKIFLQKNGLCFSVIHDPNNEDKIILSEANKDGRLMAAGKKESAIKAFAQALEYGLKIESRTVGR